eukprot:TRINITY_DN3108_c0_g1_i1.p3 TRINITY_DN3108_c0_g1~~TRINITY_DN3108_c0_g1_i1.p3  ORF type:complete len:238 (+),score=-15.61 TRINITY_DN3108_c0_g1_i1:373-1086(+)
MFKENLKLESAIFFQQLVITSSTITTIQLPNVPHKLIKFQLKNKNKHQKIEKCQIKPKSLCSQLPNALISHTVFIHVSAPPPPRSKNEGLNGFFLPNCPFFGGAPQWEIQQGKNKEKQKKNCQKLSALNLRYYYCNHISQYILLKTTSKLTIKILQMNTTQYRNVYYIYSINSRNAQYLYASDLKVILYAIIQVFLIHNNTTFFCQIFCYMYFASVSIYNINIQQSPILAYKFMQHS